MQNSHIEPPIISPAATVLWHPPTYTNIHTITQQYTHTVYGLLSPVKYVAHIVKC